MNNFENDLNSPAIKALGSRFKLTQVFLCDVDCSSGNHVASLYCEGHRSKYEKDDVKNPSAELTGSQNVEMEDANLSSKITAVGHSSFKCVDTNTSKLVIIDNNPANNGDEWSVLWDSLHNRYCFRNTKTKCFASFPPQGMESLEFGAIGDIKESSTDAQAEENYIDITKYWHQRHTLFSRYNEGIKMDGQGWFSVTPEAIAKHHASRSSNCIVLDCFAGVGGNVIQFANTSEHVIAIDIDSKKIDYALHNATIYGVEHKINFINGDWSLAKNMKVDVVFLSPPWGGPNYIKAMSYDLSMLQPCGGQLLFNAFEKIASLIIMFLPKNINLVQLAQLTMSSSIKWSLEVEQNFLNGEFKAITAYFSKSSNTVGII